MAARNQWKCRSAKMSAAKFLRKGTVQSVDYAAKHVNLQFGVLPYDHLVLACGSVSDPSTIPRPRGIVWT